MKGFSFRGFTFCAILFLSSFYSLEASLKTYLVEDQCYQMSRVFFGPQSAVSGDVQFHATSGEFVDCTIVWNAGYKVSPVLSIVSYNLHPEDELTITDSDRFSVKLVGSGFFSDERKSFSSDGDLTLRFRSNHTRDESFDRVKFHLVYTMARKGPCSFKEYECKNGKCIDESLVCDSHNHCGDRSDQKKCVPVNKKNLDHSQATYASSGTNPWIITVIVGSVILGVVLLALASVFMRQLIKKRKELKEQERNILPTHGGQPATSSFTETFHSSRKPNAEEVRSQPQRSENSQTSSVYPQIHPSPSTSADPQHPRPSFVSQVKKSFRSAKSQAKNELQRSENYQTPAMYPEIPSAPELPGVDNPNFGAEE